MSTLSFFISVAFMLMTMMTASTNGQNMSSPIANNKTCSEAELYLCNIRDTPGETCPAGLVLENVRFRDITQFGALFVVLDSLPIVLLFTLFVFFNVNITATPRHSFVFFYQIVPVVLFEAADRISVFFRSGGFLWGFVNLNNPASSSLFSVSLPFFALRYFRVLIIFLLIPVAVLIAKCARRCFASEDVQGRCDPCKSCVRKLRKRFVPGGGILEGVCSALLFGYNVALQVSFALLFTSNCCCGDIDQCPRFCQDMSLNSIDYVPYWVTSLVVLVMCLVPPIAFFLYPVIPTLWEKVFKQDCNRFNYLIPVFDVFQNPFKPRLRFFAGLYLAYRIILQAVVAFVPNRSYRTLVISCILILILVTHLLFRPMARRLHNYIESLMLVNLIVVSAGTQWLPLLTTVPDSQGAVQFIIVLLSVLTLLPFICGLLFLLTRCIIRCKKRHWKRKDINFKSSNVSLEHSLRVDSDVVNNQNYHSYGNLMDENGINSDPQTGSKL